MMALRGFGAFCTMVGAAVGAQNGGMWGSAALWGSDHRRTKWQH